MVVVVQGLGGRGGGGGSGKGRVGVQGGAVGSLLFGAMWCVCHGNLGRGGGESNKYPLIKFIYKHKTNKQSKREEKPTWWVW